MRERAGTVLVEAKSTLGPGGGQLSTILFLTHNSRAKMRWFTTLHVCECVCKLGLSPQFCCVFFSKKDGAARDPPAVFWVFSLLDFEVVVLNLEPLHLMNLAAGSPCSLHQWRYEGSVGVNLLPSQVICEFRSLSTKSPKFS